MLKSKLLLRLPPYRKDRTATDGFRFPSARTAPIQCPLLCTDYPYFIDNIISRLTALKQDDIIYKRHKDTAPFFVKVVLDFPNARTV